MGISEVRWTVVGQEEDENCKFIFSGEIPKTMVQDPHKERTGKRGRNMVGRIR